MQALVFDLKRYAVHDGPGIRTTVFLKGCPLRCWWCHNPESQSFSSEKIDREDKLGELRMISQQELGKKYSPKQLINELEKDSLFFDESGGGVTFSGGEPMSQIDFLDEALTECKRMEFHTVVDTSAHVSTSSFEKIKDKVNLFLFDLKHMDSSKHKEYIGVGNELILDNLKYLLKAGKKIIIRYPMIPKINDSIDNISSMIGFLRMYAPQVEINILPYHRIGKDKYKRFNIENKMPDIPSLSSKDCEWVKELFESAGFRTKIGG